MSFLLVLITLTPLIFIHEMGHLIASRLIKVNVHRLSIGFGPPILSYKDKTGTSWVLSLLPIGGYVQLQETNMVKGQPGADTNLKNFSECSFFEKSFVALAGPLANLVFAFFLVLVVTSFVSGKTLPILGGLDGKPLAKVTGLQDGDEIIKVNNNFVSSFYEFEKLFENNIMNNEKIFLKVKRGETIIEKNLFIQDVERDLIVSSSDEGWKFSPLINGFKVEEVYNESLGESVGFKKNDLILYVNNEKINSISSLKYITNKSLLDASCKVIVSILYFG